MTTLKIPIYGESVKNAKTMIFVSQLARIDNVKAKLEIFFVWPYCFIELYKGRRTQKDASRHRTQSGPEVAVPYRIP